MHLKTLILFIILLHDIQTAEKIQLLYKMYFVCKLKVAKHLKHGFNNPNDLPHFI